MQHTVRKVQAGQVGPREISNVRIGAAICGRSGILTILVARLARAAELRLSDSNPQAVANTAWAFATVNYRDEKLFAALARAAERRLSDCSPCFIQTALWAFSRRRCAAVSWNVGLLLGLGHVSQPSSVWRLAYGV